MIGKIKVGMMLNDAEGYYKVLEIYEKSNVFCKVRVMGFDENIIRKGIFRVEEFSKEPSKLFVSVNAKDKK